MVEDIINDITVAKNSKAYVSALALALTLPNILSNIEHNRKTHREEYVEWFNKWIYPYYEFSKSQNELINKGMENSKFDGNNCYALRCSVLHAGNNDLKSNSNNKNGIIDTFSLCVSDCSAHCGDSYLCNVAENFVGDTSVSINVIGLIDALIAGANDYISQNQEKVKEYYKSAEYKIIYGHLPIEYI